MAIKLPLPELKVRLQPALRRQIEEAAARNGRTMNAEVSARLTWSFEHGAEDAESVAKVLRVTSGEDVITDRIDGLARKVDALEARVAALESNK